MTTGYIFGDTGGHSQQLFASLKELGVDIQTGGIPEDIHIIHIGDLIHKGPDSEILVKFVNKATKTGRWTQILGNHEAQHTNDSLRFYNCSCSDDIRKILLSMKKDNRLVKSIAFDAQSNVLNGPALVTHAGLTKPLWEELGSITDLSLLTEEINNSGPLVNQTGEVFNNKINRTAGVFWASAIKEVYESWASVYDDVSHVPFHQIHGHNIIYSFPLQSWWKNYPLRFKAQTRLFFHERATVLPAGDYSFISIDPGFDRYADSEKQPFITLNKFKLF